MNNAIHLPLVVAMATLLNGCVPPPAAPEAAPVLNVLVKVTEAMPAPQPTPTPTPSPDPDDDKLKEEEAAREAEAKKLQDEWLAKEAAWNKEKAELAKAEEYRKLMEEIDRKLAAEREKQKNTKVPEMNVAEVRRQDPPEGK